MYTRVQAFISTIFFLIFLIIPVTFSLSFDMSPIKSSDVGRFNTTGDANVTTDGIQLTTNETFRAGRATYLEPLHLWDKASRNLTDFSTHFSFVIASVDKYYGDGLAFFLAPVGSSIKNESDAGGLGLGNKYGTPVNSSSLEAFVAVEFDTDRNRKYDPRPYTLHVGIDINSMRSVNTTPWNKIITEGMQNDCRISYNASSKTLMVDFKGLSRNRIQQGSLSYAVDLRDYLPEYVTVGFSAATGYWFEKHNVKSWSFDTSLRYSVSSNGKDSKGNKKGLIVELSVGLSILILASAFAFYCSWKNKELDGEDFFDSSMDNELESGTGPKMFSYSELALATNNFVDAVKLGEGGFGGVYRGFLRGTNSYVAVKRVSKGSKQGRKEYAAEVRIISQLRHINLVQLIGWCHERGELLLVYEFMPNGSLDSHLFKANSILSWELRYKIAQGLASALFYFHEDLRQYVVHRDIKASNIMLDSDFNAKLGDFGLARLVDRDKGSKTTIPAGTIGYMAPEYPVTGRASKESDIYSFGIVLLEIACGRRPIDHRCSESHVILVEWVWSLYGAGRLPDAVDPKLNSDYDARKIEQLMVVGLWCVHPDSSQRPSIRQAMQVLNSEAPWPSLPRAMPVATYNTPTTMDAHSGGATYCSNSLHLTTSSAGSMTELLPR